MNKRGYLYYNYCFDCISIIHILAENMETFAMAISLTIITAIYCCDFYSQLWYLKMLKMIHRDISLSEL